MKQLWMGLFNIFSVSLLWTYKYTTDSWILILYLTTLLNSFISSHSLLVESLVFSMYSIRSSSNKDYFTSSFPIWMAFISSSCLIAVGRISSTMLSKNCERGHPVLFPILRGTFVVFAAVWCCWQWVCHIWPLLCMV